ncbi:MULTISPECIES: H-NS family nucleoid-associated regulatory protein [Paraburkholderia]|uniref:H-NS family nucleoid-associated regulatory protein n=1 Tax=Paraburkholderia TaxID=1822464 RepID=UPI00224CA9B5|nr:MULTISPECIES: H-NS family nucleoid-associated regulatory protein [Paraburkholderia]MCX4176694.1 H-NS histone family protein [Paraburkholderia madseniana]MDQ6464685.1 H-NS histone family protein [Paraburkholderia madseniana]
MQAKIKKLQAQADALIAKQSSGVIEKIRELMAKHGLTTADIDAHLGGKQRATKAVAKTMSKGSAAAVKYRDPKSGATWTGHGRAPSWIAAAKNRDKFLVDGSTATTKLASVGKAKAAGNYVRGPQPAMYQDPKSGATWSGRGRAPAWIAEAKDRSKFLIAGVVEATVATNAAVVSKTKAAVKKASKAVGATSTKGQPKGPQPAKYRDPKSGATWSGRGPAPAWLSGAKDRTSFLIDGASAAADAGVSTKMEPAAKKAVAKQAVAKQMATKKATGKKVVVKQAVGKKEVSAKAPSTKEAPAKNATAKKAAPAASKKASSKKAPNAGAGVTAAPDTVESDVSSTT